MPTEDSNWSGQALALFRKNDTDKHRQTIFLLEKEGRLVNLETAARQIFQTCEKKKEGRRPFFFIIGAGISKPPILLASEIVKHCQDDAKKYYPEASEKDKQATIDAYSYWFNMAYPQRALRQRYLQELMHKQYIPNSQLRLAHLLLENTITNLVVTTNFDDLLTRALLLFGKEHIVCDHPKTALRIDPEQEELLQIIHVHGTYWYYDSSNLRGEIEERAGSSSQMEPLLANVLWARSPLVIGYGGWEGDVIMKSLRQRLQSDLPYNLYWFCYRFAEVLNLPDWLVKNPQVFFIVPDREPDAETTEDGQSIPKEQRAQATPRGEATTKSSVIYQLPADKVLNELIRTFNARPPELVNDPLKFYAAQLRQSIEHDNDGNIIDNVYFFKKVIERIEQANNAEQQQQAAQGDQPANHLEQVLDALRRSQHRLAIEIGSNTPLDALTTTQLHDLLNAIWSAAIGLYDNSTDELLGYETVIKIGKELLDVKKEDDTAVRLLTAKALLNKGVTLGALNETEKALDMYQEVINRFGDTIELELREIVARAFFNRGRAFDALERPQEEVKEYSEIINRFGTSTEPAITEWVAYAYNSYGFRKLLDAKLALSRNDEAEAMELLNTALEKIDKSLEIRPDDPIALGNKGYITFLSGDEEQCREILTRALTLGGEEVKQAELEDSATEELPQDKRFREIVNSIPLPPAATTTPIATV